MIADQGDGRTQSGKPITDELLEELLKKAEDGFDVDEILRRRGGAGQERRSRHFSFR